MTTEDHTPGTTGAGRAGRSGDPLGMSEAEKRMAEWEARHDVAARGHVPAPDVLQHYLAHERAVHGQRPGGRAPSAGSTAGAAHGDDPERSPATPGADLPTGERPRGLLRRLFRRRG